MAPEITPLEMGEHSERAHGQPVGGVGVTMAVLLWGLCQDMGVLQGPWGLLHCSTHPSRKISTNFPKRLELSFRTVLAFPKDSSKGVASRIWTPEDVGITLGA